MKDKDHFSVTQNTGVQPTGSSKRRVLDWQFQTIEELSQAISIEEQMIVSILAAAWRPEAGVWDGATLKALLENFARDVNTATEHKIANALRSISSGTGVLAALTSTDAIGTLTSEALSIAIAKRQLNEFFACWQKHPLISGVLVPHEQTILSRALRLGVTGLVVLNIVLFVMLFVIPEFQKMFNEFGIEMTAVSQFLMAWSDRFAKLWFIPFFLMLGFVFFFLSGSSFGRWLQRWSSRRWTARQWHRKDQRRLLTAWELRPIGTNSAELDVETFDAADSAKAAPRKISQWDQPTSMAGVLSRSESAALAMTQDRELKDWLLGRMISSRHLKRARTKNLWATILIGMGHCLLGFVVILVAVSIFGSLLRIIYGLAGERP